MKNILLRFPHLGQKIFQILDNQDLKKCLQISRSCKAFIEDQKFFWIRRIVQMTNIELCLIRREFVFLENLLKNSSFNDVQKMDSVAKNKHQKKWHSNVYYFAFLTGQTELLKKLFDGFGFKDPMERVILYHAAEIGNLEIFHLVIQTDVGKNPWCCDCGNTGDTPLHIAAEKGHFEICQLIIPYLRNKNPPRSYSYGRTPLHLAAINGHFDVFKLFFENINEKNPKNQFWLGETPLHLAAEKGHFNIFNFIIQNIEDKKNPKDYSNGTPLHRAAKNGFYLICELILQNVRIKSPKNEGGFTPRDLAEKNGHQEICQLFGKNPKKRKIR